MSVLLKSVYKSLGPRVCRCCGQKTDSTLLQQLFLPKDTNETNITPFNNKLDNKYDQKHGSFCIRDVLTEFDIWQLQIAEGDGLPQHICSKCIKQFQFIHMFRHQCLEIQSKLREIYLNSGSELRITNDKLQINSEAESTTSETINSFISPNSINERGSPITRRSSLLPWCQTFNTVTKDNNTVSNFNSEPLQPLQSMSNHKMGSLYSHSTNNGENLLLTKAAVKEYSIFESKMEEVTTPFNDQTPEISSAQQFAYKKLNLEKNLRYTYHKNRLKRSVRQTTAKRVLLKCLKIARNQLKRKNLEAINNSLKVSYKCGMQNISNNVLEQFKWRSSYNQNRCHLQNNKTVAKGYKRLRLEHQRDEVMAGEDQQMATYHWKDTSNLSSILAPRNTSLNLPTIEKIPEHGTIYYCLERNNETMVTKYKPLENKMNDVSLESNNAHLVMDLGKSSEDSYKKEVASDMVPNLSYICSKSDSVFRATIGQECPTLLINKSQGGTTLSAGQSCFYSVESQNVKGSKILIAPVTSQANFELSPIITENNEVADNIGLVTKEKMFKHLYNLSEGCSKFSPGDSSLTFDHNQNSPIENIQEDEINYQMRQNQLEKTHWEQHGEVMLLSPRTYSKLQDLQTNEIEIYVDKQKTEKYYRNNQQNIINGIEKEQIYSDNNFMQISKAEISPWQIYEYNNNKGKDKVDEGQTANTNKVENEVKDNNDNRKDGGQFNNSLNCLQGKGISKKPCLKGKRSKQLEKHCVSRPTPFFQSLENKMGLEMVSNSPNTTVNINSQLQPSIDLGRKAEGNQKMETDQLYGGNNWKPHLKHNGEENLEIEKNQKMEAQEEETLTEIQTESKDMKIQRGCGVQERSEMKRKIDSEKAPEMLELEAEKSTEEYQLPLQRFEMLNKENGYEMQEMLDAVSVKSSPLHCQPEFKYDFCSSQCGIKNQLQSKSMSVNCSLNNNRKLSQMIEDGEFYQNNSNKRDFNESTVQTTSSIHGIMMMNACKTVNNMSNYDVITAAARPSQGLVGTVNSIVDVSYHQSESTSTNKEPIRTKANNPCEIIGKEPHSYGKFSDNEQPDEACARTQNQNTFSNNDYDNCWDFIGCSIESDTNRHDSKDALESNSNDAIIVTANINANSHLPQRKNDGIVDLECKQSFEYIDKELNKFIDIVAENTRFLNKTLTYDAIEVVTTVSQLEAAETTSVNFRNFYTSGQSKEMTECSETTSSSFLSHLSSTSLPSTGQSLTSSPLSIATPLPSLASSASSTTLFNNELIEVENALNGILNEMQNQSASKNMEETTINSISDSCHPPELHSGNHYIFNQDGEMAGDYSASSYNDNNVTLQSENYDYQNNTPCFGNIQSKSMNQCNQLNDLNNSNYTNSLNTSALLNYHHSELKTDSNQNQHGELQSSIGTENNYITIKHNRNTLINQEQRHNLQPNSYLSGNLSSNSRNNSAFPADNLTMQNNKKPCSETNSGVAKTAVVLQNLQTQVEIANKSLQICRVSGQGAQTSQNLHLSDASNRLPQAVGQVEASIITGRNDLSHPGLVKLPEEKSLEIYSATATTLNLANNSKNHVTNSISVVPVSTVSLSLTTTSALPPTYYGTANVNSLLLNGEVIPYETTLARQPSISRSANITTINHRDYGSYLATAATPATLSSVANNNLLPSQYMVISPTPTYNSSSYTLPQRYFVTGTPLMTSSVILERDKTYNNNSQITVIPMSGTMSTEISIPLSASKPKINNINSMVSHIGSNSRSSSSSSNDSNIGRQVTGNTVNSEENVRNQLEKQNIRPPRQLKHIQPRVKAAQTKQEVNLTCRFCHKRRNFTNNIDYSNHIIAEHPACNPFNCPYCPMHFQRRVHRQKHISLRHTEQGFECPQCNTNFYTQRTLDKHLQRYHKITSNNDCSWSCGTPSPEQIEPDSTSALTLAENQIQISSNPANPANPCNQRIVEEQMRRGNYQDTRDDHLRELNEDFEKSSEERAASLSSVIARTLATHYYHCPICDRGFRLRSGLKRHMVVHDATGRPFECSECPKRFPSYFHLKFHKFTVHKIPQTAASEKDCSDQN